jgi:glycerol-3-phosphate dehydrogenase
VLVVGGGVTGCGVALDAAARGLRTALVEARDFAHGTSSRSSKLVHGGLRYLQQRDFLLVYEALHERRRLIRNAPHLVHPLPFLIPLFGRDGTISKSLVKSYSAALWMYDLTGGMRIGRLHRRIPASDALRHFPGLRTDTLVASFLYWDAQADDARLTLALARTAAGQGAAVANYAPVQELVEEGGRVAGARLSDGTEVRADVVINAGGVWSDLIAGLAPGSISPVSIRPAKGIHLVVPSDRLPCDFAAVLAVPGDRRSIFVVPWAASEATGPLAPGRYTYLGTTDTDYSGPLDDPKCTAEDVEYVLRAVNRWTRAALTPADVSGTWAGLRPLISDAHSARTADLSRRHTVITSPNGLVTVTGGKLTTYRKMAAEAVDCALGQIVKTAALVPDGPWAPSGPRRWVRSPTRRLVLVGGESQRESYLPAATQEAVRLGIDAAALEHLVGRHGDLVGDVLALCRENTRLAEPLVPGLPYLKAEAIYAARFEMARTLEDVLARRTRALILDRNASARAAPAVAEIIAADMGWDRMEQDRQVLLFQAEVDSERSALEAAVTP